MNFKFKVEDKVKTMENITTSKGTLLVPVGIIGSIIHIDEDFEKLNTQPYLVRFENFNYCGESSWWAYENQIKLS